MGIRKDFDRHPQNRPHWHGRGPCIWSEESAGSTHPIIPYHCLSKSRVQSAQDRLQSPLISGGKGLQGSPVSRPPGELRLHPISWS